MARHVLHATPPQEADDVSQRKHERVGFFRRANWDFFTGSTGRKTGFITNVSKGGCLLKTSDPIDHRRWIRILIEDHASGLYYTMIGRVIRRENAIESISSMNDTEITLYRYGIEFTYPNFVSNQDQDLILALSSKNLTVRSCLNLNMKSSLRDESLA